MYEQYQNKAAGLTGPSGLIGASQIGAQQQNAIPRDKSSVEIAFDANSQALQALRQVAAELERRLEPVLSPSAATDSGRDKRPSMNSQLAEAVMVQAETVGEVIIHLNSLINRLTI